MNISNLASVHPNAKIGENVSISPFTTISEDVEIGDGTWIGPNVTIMDGARIGKNCKVFPGAVISAPPQDLKYKGERTITVIGNHTTIRECVTINRGTTYSDKTQIGDHCLVMAYSHLAHDCIIGNHCILSNNSTLAGHIIVGDYAIIGGLVAIHQFSRIGDHTYIGGGSLVRKDIPPFVKAAREPIGYVGVNSVGLSRRGYSKDQIVRIENIYRILFKSNLSVASAILKIEETIEDSDEKTKCLDFIKSSERGIMKGMNAKK